MIAGTLRGRRIRTSTTLAVRPTLERVREAVFNSLGDAIADAVVLDLFAGTGALGIEALSRGARRAVFVESSRQAVANLRANARRLGITSRADLVTVDAFRADPQLSRWAPYDVVFVDPPWHYWTEPGYRVLLTDRFGTWQSSGLLAPDGTICLEEPAHAPDLASQLGWPVWRSPRRYGETRITLLRTPANQT